MHLLIFLRTKPKIKSISNCFPGVAICICKTGRTDAEGLRCEAVLRAHLTLLPTFLLPSCRLQQHLLLHGAIPDVEFWGAGQLIGLKYCLAFFLSLVCHVSQATEQSPHYLCVEASYLQFYKAHLVHFDSLLVLQSRGFQFLYLFMSS